MRMVPIHLRLVRIANRCSAFSQR